jgi:hypothetical protein
MADRSVPDAFAADLTGVYATDPNYGSNLIALMRLYDLYRYDAGVPVSAPATVAPGGAPAHGSAPAHGGQATQGGADIPGLLPTPSLAAYSSHLDPTQTATLAATRAAVTRAAATRAATASITTTRTGSTRAAAAGVRPARYQAQIPAAVTNAFLTTARTPIMRAEALYRDVASYSGIRWELLAACDWMQCRAHPRYSPVHGEKLGSRNADGTAYHTKSEALAQCASDLVELAATVYGIRLQGRKDLSVRDLANVFAAFRWGKLLRQHGISAMEFPYSVQGLSAHHMKMRWPKIPEQNSPDRPGTRFRMPFGAVPVVLSLDYPAVT